MRAAICLHNFLRQANSAANCLKNFTDSYDSIGQIKGEWRAMVKFNDGMLKDIPGFGAHSLPFQRWMCETK